MNDGQNKFKDFVSNPQNRLVVIIGGLVGTVVGFFLLSYLLTAIGVFSEGSGNSVAVVEGTPSIESIPGIGDPSVEYSRLIANQNKAQVEAAEKEGGSSLPTIIRPQYSLNTGEFNYEGSNIERDENRCSRENLLKARRSGVAASELKCYGCSAEDMRLAGYGAAELRAAGFSAEALKDAGYSASELKEAGYSGADLRAAGYSAEDLLDAGYSVQELLASGFSPKQLLNGGATLASLKSAGVDIDSLLADGVNANDMIKSGYCANGVMLSVSNPKQLRLDGVSAQDLYDGGASINQLLDYGYSIQEVLDLGISVSQMIAAGVSGSDLREIGISKKDVSFAEKNLSQVKGGICTVDYAKAQYNAGVQARVLWPLGCQVGVLKEAGYSARDLVREGLSAGQMRMGGYSASNLVGAGVPLQELVEACYSVDSLLEAGFTSSQLVDAGVAVSDLLAYGFSPTELAASGVNCAEMFKGGVAVSDLYSLGCNPEELRNAGASAADLLGAGYSAGDLRAAGYSVGELMNAGVSAEDLLALGVSPAELLAAGFTEGQLLRAGATADSLFGGNEDKGIGCSIERVNAALSEGSTVSDLLEKGCSAESLLNAGIGPSELLAAGVSVDQLLKAGIGVSDLIAAGVSVDQLVAANADPRDLFLAGVSLEDLKGYTLDQLRAAGYDVSSKESNDLLIEDNSESDLERVQRLQNEALEEQDRERRVLQLSAAMQAQASALFSNWDTMPRQTVNVSGKSPKDYGNYKGSASNPLDSSMDFLGNVVKAGSMMYATVDNSINSEDPAPILATIVNGPLKGAKILGEFEQQGEKLVLKFDRIDIPSQRNTKDITLFAVDVNTARNVTVDSHYLLKYGSLFAASFLEGLNEVASSIGTSVTTSGDTVTVKEGSLDKSKILAAGLGKVGKNLVAETSKFQSKQPTIRMHAGATFGILVMEDFMVGL